MIKTLENLGFYQRDRKRKASSHVQYKKDGVRNVVTVSDHNNIRKGILNNIIRDSEVEHRAFIDELLSNM
jgi:predicted RNA binding protein YcfA (HicA-like mRNA interferase family)